MRNQFSKAAHSEVVKSLFFIVLGLVVLATAGCKGGSPSSSDGEIRNDIVLPTDTNLNLYCEDVGIFMESCIEEDPANPYRFVVITEFDAVNEIDGNKFDLFSAIPAGPTGAKARFYLMATALARRSSGENQWYAAQALHELWTAQPVPDRDPLVREQTLKAYESVLENYFGSVTFFDFILPPSSFQLNKLTVFNMRCPNATLADLFAVAGSLPNDLLATISGWGNSGGFTYVPPTPPCSKIGASPPELTDDICECGADAGKVDRNIF